MNTRQLTTRLRQLSERLLNITRKNRSIRLLRKTKQGTFDAAEVDALRPLAAMDTLKAVMADKQACLLSARDCPPDPVSARHELTIDDDEQLEEHETPQFRNVRLFRKLESNLVQLARTAESIEAETGAMDLYLGFPWLCGNCSDTDATYLQAPLLLYPVQLRAERSPTLRWMLLPRDDAEPIFNEALVLALEQFNETRLPPEFIESAEDFGDETGLKKDPLHLVQWFHDELSRLGLRMRPAHPELQPLPEFRAKDVPTDWAGFEIRAHAVIGVFHQSDSSLRNDYEQLLKDVESGTLETNIAELLGSDAAENTADPDAGKQTPPPQHLDHLREQETCWVLDSDATQEEAMLRARHDPALVIHGPPGTGKSQVICNMIADALHRGERVLVCCQKRAALDVVFQRMERVGLGRHVALVHDHANDRQHLYRRLAHILDELGAPPLWDPTDIDAERIASEIDAATAKLRRIAEELHKPRRCGLTARALFAQASKGGLKTDTGSLSRYANHFDGASRDRFLKELERLQGLYTALTEPSKYWSGRRSFAQFTFAEPPRIERALQDIEQAARELGEVEQKVGASEGEAKLAAAAEGALRRVDALLQSAAAETLRSAARLTDATFAGQVRAITTALQQMLPEIQRHASRPRAPWADAGLDMALALETYENGRRSWLRWFNGRWRAARERALEFARLHNIAHPPDDLRAAAADIRAHVCWRKVDHAVSGTALAAEVAALAGASELEGFVKEWQGALTLMTNLGREFAQCGALKPALEALVAHPEQLRPKVQNLLKLAGAYNATLERLRVMESWLGEKAIEILRENAAKSGRKLLTLADNLRRGLENFDKLQEIDEIKARLRPVEREILRELRSDSTRWGERFNQAVVVGWLEEVEREAPELRAIGNGEVDQLRSAYGIQLKKRRELNGKRLARDLWRRATERRSEPGKPLSGRQNPGRPWEKLKNEVTKKRRIWPLRRLVHELEWPLLEVMPCWLASPETVAAIFPLRKVFDLVIFDEASQLAVQFGLPVVARAKRVVVAGDEQQLRPFDLFGRLGVRREGEDDVAPEDDEGDTTAIEQESLLTLAKVKYPETMLRCHYRSRFEELIEFSNHGFYKGRLVTVSPPDAKHVIPIEWRKVSGTWEDRRNAEEASAVLDLLTELLGNGRGRRIGIITFNDAQMNEILDQMDRRCGEDPVFAELITQARNPSSHNRDDALFVKNIENVQGDERDIIIFSIGYAPDPSGRVFLRFGSLSMEGGDNRLNVAVSRAKERIYVVTSIEPEQLDVSNVKNRGPRLMRSYLEYAKAVSTRQNERFLAVLRDINPDLDRQSEAGNFFDSPFEEQVCEALRRHNLIVDAQVGISGYRIDLAIADPELPSRYVLGIECDGATYHSASCVRERDAYRQRFLESRGWKIHRIWSRNWWRNANAEVEKVLKLLREELAAARSKPVEAGLRSPTK